MNTYPMEGTVLGVSSAAVSMKNKWTQPITLGGSLESVANKDTGK